MTNHLNRLLAVSLLSSSKLHIFNWIRLIVLELFFHPQPQYLYQTLKYKTVYNFFYFFI